MWKYYALLSALFASITAILAKIGVKGVDSNLATAIRTTVILFLVWFIFFFTGHTRQLTTLSKTNILFLTLSGIATGLSWLFYFKALQLGNVSQVALVDKFSVVLTILFAAIFLNETLNLKVALGATLILSGTLLLLSK